jgi:hypothetical protein
MRGREHRDTEGFNRIARKVFDEQALHMALREKEWSGELAEKQRQGRIAEDFQVPAKPRDAALARELERFERSMSPDELRERIARWARERGVDEKTLRAKYGPRAMRRERALLAYELWVYGATYSQIGAALGGRGRATIHYWVKELGQDAARQAQQVQRPAPDRLALRRATKRILADVDEFNRKRSA